MAKDFFSEEIGNTRDFFSKEISQEPSFIQKGLSALATGAGLGVGGLATIGAYKSIKKIGSKITEYPYNKTLAIREGLLKNRKAETTAYGKSLRTISKADTSLINPSGVLEDMETTLRQKGILGQFNEKAGIPSNEIDRQFYKSYENLMNKFAKAKEGKIPINEILQEARNIKAKGGKVGTFKNKLANDLHDSIVNSVKPQIKSEQFSATQQRYASYKQKQAPLEEIFQPFESKFKTGKAERTLTNVYNQPVGTRKALENIPEITGQKITGAKVISRVNKLNPLNLLRGGRLLGIAPMLTQAIGFVRQMEEAKKKGMFRIDAQGNIIPISKEDLII